MAARVRTGAFGLAVGLLLACSAGCASPPDDAAQPRTVVYSVSPAPPSPSTPASPTSAPTPRPTARATAPATAPSETRYPLVASDRHLLATSGEAFAARGSCDIDDRTAEVAACTDVTGSGGTFRVWVGYAERSQAWQVRVLEVSGGTLRQAARSVFTADFQDVRLHVATVSAEPVVLIEYELGGPDRRHDLDVATWERGQARPGVAASLAGIVSPGVTASEGGIEIATPNYHDGAPLCCPRYVDRTRFERIAPRTWEAVVRTEELEDYESPLD